MFGKKLERDAGQAALLADRGSVLRSLRHDALLRSRGRAPRRYYSLTQYGFLDGVTMDADGHRPYAPFTMMFGQVFFLANLVKTSMSKEKASKEPVGSDDPRVDHGVASAARELGRGRARRPPGRLRVRTSRTPKTTTSRRRFRSKSSRRKADREGGEGSTMSRAVNVESAQSLTFLGMSWRKVMMWIFIITDGLLFAGFSRATASRASPRARGRTSRRSSISGSSR